MVSHDQESSRLPILIACDAGAAGRDLLVRRDLELAWALTHDEADAYLAHHRPGLVIVREAMAAEMLTRAREHAPGVPVMVLLEPDGWANREGYLDLGAAVLAQSSARDLILQAVAELSGRPFAQHTRVPFTEFIEVIMADGQSRMAETIDMSASGLGVRYLAGAEVGMSVRAQLDNVDPPLSLPAVVLRADEEVVGLRFLELEPDVRAQLEKLVELQNARFPPPEMPEGLTVDVGGTFTMELLEASTSELGPDKEFRSMMRAAVVENTRGREGWPRWLVNLERKLTGYERRSFELDPLISHASAAIDLRILLARARSEEPYTFPTRNLAQQVLDFSRLLEDHGDAAPKDLADIAILRGHLLRAVYGDLSTRGGGTPDRAAAA